MTDDITLLLSHVRGIHSILSRSRSSRIGIHVSLMLGHVPSLHGIHVLYGNTLMLLMLMLHWYASLLHVYRSLSCSGWLPHSDRVVGGILLLLLLLMLLLMPMLLLLLGWIAGVRLLLGIVWIGIGIIVHSSAATRIILAAAATSIAIGIAATTSAVSSSRSRHDWLELKVWVVLCSVAARISIHVH